MCVGLLGQLVSFLLNINAAIHAHFAPDEVDLVAQIKLDAEVMLAKIVANGLVMCVEACEVATDRIDVCKRIPVDSDYIQSSRRLSSF